jgi:hypothetical protein
LLALAAVVTTKADQFITALAALVALAVIEHPVVFLLVPVRIQ